MWPWGGRDHLTEATEGPRDPWSVGVRGLMPFGMVAPLSQKATCEGVNTTALLRRVGIIKTLANIWLTETEASGCPAFLHLRVKRVEMQY